MRGISYTKVTTIQKYSGIQEYSVAGRSSVSLVGVAYSNLVFPPTPKGGGISIRFFFFIMKLHPLWGLGGKRDCNACRGWGLVENEIANVYYTVIGTSINNISVAALSILKSTLLTSQIPKPSRS